MQKKRDIKQKKRWKGAGIKERREEQEASLVLYKIKDDQ
jgi:hypothetical protein